jgi:hypothetical protein
MEEVERLRAILKAKDAMEEDARRISHIVAAIDGNGLVTYQVYGSSVAAVKAAVKQLTEE